jgi:hypothetical protein
MTQEYNFTLTDDEVSLVLNALRHSNISLREASFVLVGTELNAPANEALNRLYKLEQKIFHARREQQK